MEKYQGESSSIEAAFSRIKNIPKFERGKDRYGREKKCLSKYYK